MADFVAVLKKTLDGLGPTTPDMRDKVYDKARATVTAKLDAINPPPSAAVRDRQMAALEDAIATIERGYSDRPRGKPASPLDELEEVFASLSGLKERDKAPSPPRPAPPYSAPPRPAPAAPAQSTPAPQAREVAPPPPPPAPPADALPGDDEPVLAAPRAEDTFVAEERDDDIAAGEPVRQTLSRPRRSYGGLVAALIALVVVAGGGYGVWLNKDAFAALFSSDPAAPKQAAAPAKPEAEETATPAKPPAEPEPPTEVAAATPDDASAPADPPKYTQRLNADGSETDMGAAEAEPTIGEGTSVAQATQPSEPAAPAADPDEPAAAAPAEPEAPATPDAEAPDAEAPAEPEAATTPPAEAAALPVGQKAIFYEERTSTAQGSAEPGSIVWSLVQESPGGDLPPEPAIQAQASIPGKDLQLRMIIRRNGDRTLPASHIIEMIFITPEGFEGGGVDNVLRVAMKSSEQEAGSPLLGIPAKIADGYFLIALNDAKPEVEANLSLLRRQSWIDVPMVYKSGRRALFTMEKGIPGEKVFEEAMKAWGNAGNG